jgi:hypothetical protein
MASLGRIGNLTGFDLSATTLIGPVTVCLNSKGIGKLVELRSMDAAINRLDSAIPDNLFEAPKLEIVHLYSNSVTGPCTT